MVKMSTHLVFAFSFTTVSAYLAYHKKVNRNTISIDYNLI